MAGYSGTPLARKLGIHEGAAVALLGAPPGFEAELAPLPEGVRLHARLPRPSAAPLDVAVVFTVTRAQLERRFAPTAARVQPAGGLWVAWPKRASGRPTDLTEGVVREVGLARGLVDNKVAALNDVWSGLRFVLRLRDRPRTTPGGANR